MINRGDVFIKQYCQYIYLGNFKWINKSSNNIIVSNNKLDYSENTWKDCGYTKYTLSEQELQQLEMEFL